MIGEDYIYKSYRRPKRWLQPDPLSAQHNIIGDHMMEPSDGPTIKLCYFRYRRRRWRRADGSIFLPLERKDKQSVQCAPRQSVAWYNQQSTGRWLLLQRLYQVMHGLLIKGWYKDEDERRTAVCIAYIRGESVGGSFSNEYNERSAGRAGGKSMATQPVPISCAPQSSVPDGAVRGRSTRRLQKYKP